MKPDKNSIPRWIKDSLSRLVTGYSKLPRETKPRKEAAAALINSEDKFKYVFDNSVMGKSITLPSGDVEVNKAFCELLGYSSEELQNKKWQDITHPDDIELSQQALDPILSGEKDSARFVKRYIHKNGSVVWGDVGTSLRRDKDGKPLYFMTSVSDITARKLVEERIKHLNAVLMAIRNVNQIIVREKDPEKLIKRACEVLTKERGYFTVWIALSGDSDKFSQIAASGFNGTFKLLEECIRSGKLGKCALALREKGVHVIHDPSRECRDCPASKSYNNQSAVAIQLQHEGRRHGLMVLSMDTRMANDAEEQHLISEVADDIAYSLQNLAAEKSHADILARYRTLFEQSQDAILVSTQEGTIEEANSAGAAIFGLTPQTVCSQRAVDLYVNPADRQAVVQELKQHGSISNHAVTYRRADGSIFDALINTQIVPRLEGTGVHYLSTVRDITEVKRAQDTLRESEGRLSAVFKSNLIGISVTRLSDGQYVDVNDAFLKLFGYTRVEALSHTSLQLRTWAFPEDRAKVINILRDKRSVQNYEASFLKSTGKMWTGLFSAEVIDITGEPHILVMMQDVTDHRQAEEEIRRINDELEEMVKQRTAQLQDALEFNQKIINTSSLGIFACREDGPCIIANPAVARISGASVEQMLKINFRELDSWKKNGLFQKVETALQTKEEQRAEIHLTTSFGRDAWINYYITTFGSRGKLHFLMIVEDITERKLVEVSIARANAYNRSLFEASIDPLFTIGSDGKITDVNKATETITGCTRQELIGTEFSDYFTDPEKANAIYRQVFAEGLVRNYELQLQHKNGKITPVHYNATVYRDDSGCIIGAFAAARDVTEIKNATAMLISSKQLLEETGGLARVGGWELDLRKNELIWSDVVKQIHEVDPEYQPTIEAGINFYAPEAVPVISEAVRHATEDGEPYDIELQLITAKQNRIWVRTIGQAFRDNGKIIKIGGVFQDIDSRKHAEQEHEALMKQIEHRSSLLEAANKELEAFTYSVSHDLRAPLRHINGYVELLTSRFRETLPEKGIHYLDTIADSARQMAALIDDLLQFSRTGRQEMQQADIDMNIVLQEILKTIKHDNTGRSIEWVIATLPHVYGDQAMLRLVWLNLLDNAVKFTRRKEKTRIEVGYSEDDMEYVFFVRDNGTGFDMQYAHKLFGVFQRLHSSEEFEGTGIGLANVRRIILKHGGRTWAEAELDKGAVFYFTLLKNKESIK